MKKIIGLFVRNHDGDRKVRNEITPGAEWVTSGEGIPTRKLDGTCCMVRAGQLYKRFDAKRGKTPPPGFEPAQAPDPETGHWPGWIPVGAEPESKYHREAFGRSTYEDGTYELLGPKIQGNPKKMIDHRLYLHGHIVLKDFVPPPFAVMFDYVKEYLNGHDIEGIVWHHPDGRMVKIKTGDFGLKRGESAAAQASA